MAEIDPARFRTQTVFGGPMVAREPSPTAEVVDVEQIVQQTMQHAIVKPKIIRLLIDAISVTERLPGNSLDSTHAGHCDICDEQARWRVEADPHISARLACAEHVTEVVQRKVISIFSDSSKQQVQRWLNLDEEL